MTLVLRLDLDVVLIYHFAKKKVSIPFASKVIARTDTQTHGQTDRQTDMTKTLPLHIQVVIIPIYLNLTVNSTVM